MAVVLYSDVAGKVVISKDLGNGSFEYWNNTLGSWSSTPAAAGDAEVTIEPDPFLAGTPFANVNRAVISGDMGTSERVMLHPFDGANVIGTPRSVTVYKNAIASAGENREQLRSIKGDAFNATDDTLEAIRATLDSVPTDVDTLLASQHGSGAWQTATGYATPTDVTDEATRVINHGDLNWVSGIGGAGIVPAVPDAIEIPSSGTVDYVIDARTYNSSGDAVDADSLPEITLTNASGTNLEDRLLVNGVPGTPGTPRPMQDIGEGHYRVIYRSDAAHTVEQILWQFDAVISATSYVSNQQTQVTATVATGFTQADRAKLDSLNDVKITTTRAANLDNLTTVPASSSDVLAQVNSAWDSANGAELGISLRQALKAAAAAGGGVVAAPAPGTAGTVTVFAIGNSTTPRIVATVDALGQRTSVTPSLS